MQFQSFTIISRAAASLSAPRTALGEIKATNYKLPPANPVNMVFDVIRFAFLTLAAADLGADLTSAKVAFSQFRSDLWVLYHSSTEVDVPTSYTSVYQSFSSALSSFNGALEGVVVDDFTSGSTALFDSAGYVLFYLDYVVYTMGQIVDVHKNGTGDFLSFMQDIVEGMNEPSTQLVEKVNSLIVDECSIAKFGFGPSEGFYIATEASSFSYGYTSVASEVSASVSLPTVACISDAGASTARRISTLEQASSGSYATPTGADAGESTAGENSTPGDESSGSYATPIRSSGASVASESGADEESQFATSTNSGISIGASQSSTSEDSTSAIDSSMSPESLMESSTQRETAINSASSSEAESSSTKAASVTSGRAPILAVNVGIFVPLFAMLL